MLLTEKWQKVKLPQLLLCGQLKLEFVFMCAQSTLVLLWKITDSTRFGFGHTYVHCIAHMQWSVATSASLRCIHIRSILLKSATNWRPMPHNLFYVLFSLFRNILFILLFEVSYVCACTGHMMLLNSAVFVSLPSLHFSIDFFSRSCSRSLFLVTTYTHTNN